MGTFPETGFALRKTGKARKRLTDRYVPDARLP
jgi:hypothetical protein